MIKFTMTDCEIGNVGQLSNTSTPAYLECGECEKHSKVAGNAGGLKCPHCGSGHIGRLEMGRGVPAWFKGEK